MIRFKNRIILESKCQDQTYLELSYQSKQTFYIFSRDSMITDYKD
jgi:hypothetical protein